MLLYFSLLIPVPIKYTMNSSIYWEGPTQQVLLLHVVHSVQRGTFERPIQSPLKCVAVLPKSV